ncbi:MAG TPA: HAD-IB family hydrolase [Acidimicrobiia bacterium]|nr:HAD-IB family hydrolase [Acidimicrobiia bacterium]
MSRIDAVAAFDFDGTLSSRDNFVPFLREVAGTPAFARASVAGGVDMLRSGRPQWSRNHLKAEVLQRLFAGRDASDLDRVARTFAADILARHLRAEAVELADWHRTQGHRLVIVSASLGVYLRPIAEQLRFDAVLATELEVGDDGTLTGRMDGENVRGPEKARRLDAWLAREAPDATPFVWAYGDSSGDQELWARADRAVRLGRRAHRGTS